MSEAEEKVEKEAGYDPEDLLAFLLGKFLLQQLKIRAGHSCDACKKYSPQLIRVEPWEEEVGTLMRYCHSCFVQLHTCTCVRCTKYDRSKESFSSHYYDRDLPVRWCRDIH